MGGGSLGFTIPRGLGPLPTGSRPEQDGKMALQPCRSCQREVSSEAAFCPHCGAPQPARQNWRGPGFEWRSSLTFSGYPLVHIAFGRDEKGKLRVAKGIIAIGQFGIGLITFAQFGVGLLFGFGQFIFGLMVLAQFAGGLWFGIGQMATGYVAIGQFVIADLGLAQFGWARSLWSPERQDPEAVAYFRQLWDNLHSWW